MTCPRCGGESNGEFYGPCQACRDQLNEKYFKEPVARAAKESTQLKANVQYNAVALKAERDDDDVDELGAGPDGAGG